MKCMDNKMNMNLTTIVVEYQQVNIKSTYTQRNMVNLVIQPLRGW